MKTTTFILAFIISISCVAQELSKAEEDQLRSMLNEENQEPLFDYVARNEFSRIAKVNSNGSMGNMVGISTTDDNLSFGYYWVHNKSTFEINAAGGITEGAATIFSSQKLNTGASIGFKYNKIFKLSKFSLDRLPVETIAYKDKELQNKLNLHKASNLKDPSKLEKDVSDKEATLLKLQNELVQLKNRKNEEFYDLAMATELQQRKTLTESEIELLSARLDSLEENKAFQVTELKKKVKNNDPNGNLQNKVDSLSTELLIFELNDKRKAKKSELKQLDQKIKSNTVDLQKHDDRVKALQKKINFAETDAEVAKNVLDLFNNGRSSNKYTNDGNTITKEIHDNLLKVKELKAMNVHLLWVSLGGSLKSESFNLFNDTMSYANQIYKQEDLVPSVNLSITYYSNESSNVKLASRHVRYFTAGATLKYGNNLGSLTQLDIVTNDSIAANRYSTKTTKAYQGEYKDNVVTSQVYSDYYQFIGDIDNVGFHIRGTVDIGPQRPVTSLRFGLIYAAINKENHKSVANFEIFYGLNNVFKNGEEQSLFSRNIIGIQSSFPFDFKLKNK